MECNETVELNESWWNGMRLCGMDRKLVEWNETGLNGMKVGGMKWD